MHRPAIIVSLLDDDPAVLKAMTRLLRSVGCTVTAFADPLAFLDPAAEHRPPVAIIDVRMPVMNGLQVQSQLQSHSPSTNVVFLTSQTDRATRESALKAGAFAFLLKPACEDELVSIIRSAAAHTR
jgi:FixJ family two-component response regulator